MPFDEKEIDRELAFECMRAIMDVVYNNGKEYNGEAHNNYAIVEIK